MTDEQRKAVERLRRVEHEEDMSSVYGCDDSFELLNKWAFDVDVLLVEYFAEHPSDDDKQATEEWLRSVGFAEGTWHPLVMQAEDIEIRCTFTALKLGHRSDEFDVTRSPTRGDVRRLCSALGIHLELPLQ